MTTDVPPYHAARPPDVLRPPAGRANAGWSDLHHLEVFLARAAFRAGPVNGNIFPTRARRDPFIRQTGFFVVDPAADQAHPASIFHSCVASKRAFKREP